MSTKKEILSTVIWILAILALSLFVTKYIGQRAVVDGTSMEPTLQDRDNLLLDKVTYRFSKPQRYDIVIFPGNINENGQKQMYIKRVIGLPGETVEIKDGSVYINGEVLKTDTYAKEKYTEGDTEFSKITLKDNEYYVLGDNRANSEDSRYIGPVVLKRRLIGSPDLYEIVGKIQMRIFPFSKIRIL